MLNKNNYLVKSANWSMAISIDETIFDDPHIEACTRCIENKIKTEKDIKTNEKFIFG